jgi:hypothetical protein
MFGDDNKEELLKVVERIEQRVTEGVVNQAKLLSAVMNLTTAVAAQSVLLKQIADNTAAPVPGLASAIQIAFGAPQQVK